MAENTIDQKPLTVTFKIILAIIISTATTVGAYLSSQYEIKAELNSIKSDLQYSIKSIENENRIQELKYENLYLQVQQNKISIDKLRDEFKQND